MKIYQRLYNGSYETLYVKKNGKIICECVGNLFNKNRDVESTCRHALDLRKALKEKNLHLYRDVTPQ